MSKPRTGISKLVAVCCYLVLVSFAAGARRPTSKFVERLDGGDAQTIVVYGTSLTAGGQWTKQVAAVLKARFGDKAVLKNAASSGKDSNWGVENIEARVFPHKPDVLFIEFGMNDAIHERSTSLETAKHNLETMIARTLTEFPDCEIILMSMNPDLKHLILNRPKQSRTHLAQYYAMYSEMAAERGLQHIDLHAAWTAFLGEDVEKAAKHIPDGVHPNGLGCKTVVTPAILTAIGVEHRPDDIPIWPDPPKKKPRQNRQDSFKVES